MATQHIHSTTRLLLAILLSSAHLTGCFVAVDDYDDDYYEDGYYEDVYYEDVYYEDDISYDSYDNRSDDVFEDDFFEEEVVEEEIIEEETTEETTTTVEVSARSDNDSSTDDTRPSVETIPIGPAESGPLFEERFEDPALSRGDHISLSQLGAWMIEWTPGSSCEGIAGSATISLQSERDLGAQGEVEGLQHARLDGECGDELHPTQITTSLEGVRGARSLTLYARSAADTVDAELQVEWAGVTVMRETLTDGWAQYRIDLTATDRPDEALLTLSALTTGVIIDHIEVE